MPEPSPDALIRLPKALLHDHLDGSLRVSTLLALCRAQGIEPPAPDVPRLAAWFQANSMAGSLERYLMGFGLTVSALASRQALIQVAQEAAEDARAEGCMLVELRMAPLLLEPLGLDPDEAVQAMLEGLRRAAVPSGLIVCGMRHESPERVQRAAELALRHRSVPGGGPGVVGFDLAGPERGFPATRHRAALELVLAAGLPLTLHAGEADEGARVLEAIRLGARRIGHGVRLADLLGGPQGPAILAELQSGAIHLEVCPSSNVHTGAAASISEHPIRQLWDAGVSLSFQTDNRLISCTTMVEEGAALMRHAGFTLDDLARMQALAIEASFLPESARLQARDAMARWRAAPGSR